VHHLEVDFGGVVVALDSDGGEAEFGAESALDSDSTLGSGRWPDLELQAMVLMSGSPMMVGSDLRLVGLVLGSGVFFIIEN
jgi:hypothetical protein